MSPTPLTVSCIAEAVIHVGGGNFIANVPFRHRIEQSAIFGSPIFALQTLFPELLEQPQLHLLVDYADHIALDGGRWLSLYLRTLKCAGKVSFSLCGRLGGGSRRMPVREILIQPHLPVSYQPWFERLPREAIQPDVLLLFAMDNIDKLDASLREAVQRLPGRRLLVGCLSFLDAVILAEALRLLGFDCQEPVSFDVSPGKSRVYGPGAWWLAAVIPSELDTQTLDQAGIDRAYGCWSMMQSLCEVAKREQTANAMRSHLQRTGRRLKVAHVDGEEVMVLSTSLIVGFELSTGRMFQAADDDDDHDDDREYPRIVWTGYTLPASVLELLPVVDEQVPSARSVFSDLAWLVEAMQAYHSAQATAAAPIPSSSSGSTTCPEALPIANSDALASATTEAIPAPMVEAAADDPAAVGRRPRLSRAAGRVDVLALAGQLGKPGADAGDLFRSARSMLMRWLAKRGLEITDPTINSHIDGERGEVTIETDGQTVLAMRLDDRRSLEQGTLWRVEATLICSSQAALGLRLSQVRPSEQSPSPAGTGVPGVVVDMANTLGLSDAGVPFHANPIVLSGSAGGERLIGLIENADRVQPLVVLTLPATGQLDASFKTLSRRLVGVAHLVRVDPVAGDEVRLKLGSSLAATRPGVRIFRPGGSARLHPGDHPQWPIHGVKVGAGVADDIFESAAAISLEYAHLDERVPSFQAVREGLSSRRVIELTQASQSSALSAAERLDKLLILHREMEDAAGDFREQINDLKHRNSLLQAELVALRDERDSARDEVRALNHRLDSSWRWLPTDDTNPEDEIAPDYPDNWDDLETWIAVYGGEHLVLHPKASKAARASSFRDIALAYKALDYLARFYVPMRTRRADDDEPYERAQAFLIAHGLEDSDVGTADEMHRYKAQYQRIHDGRTITLDRHLKRGVGMDPTTVFRLYYHFDEDTGSVIVGHLPSHLVNRATH